ncbi:T9SS type A sorting domain-containing protein [Saccharicrinis aurantiacus]|uniref:T9SS type A sorting domain-containing protein n=1 Tax=Saccharicrinis aurantiacus TaxID=1849719 RepID=UPI0024902B0A|nr:T9SS type A sorting domain-containing protein [Saccharicrinis aurantiacus]
MKKVYFLILAIACITMVTSAQTTLTIKTINGVEPATFKADQPLSATDYAEVELVKGEALTVVVEYTNAGVLPAYGKEIILLRFLDGYGTIANESGAVIDVSANPTSGTETVVISVPNSDVTKATGGRLQAFTKDHISGGDVSAYFGTFDFVDGTPLAMGSVKADLSSCYYAASKSAIVMDPDLEGDYAIYNLSGQLVLNGTVESQINVSALSSGMYILSCNGGVLKFAK